MRGITTAERQDYSGPFDPDITLEDFSKQAHMRLCKAATKMYLNIDAAWRGAVEKRFGKEVALELSRRVDYPSRSAYTGELCRRITP